MLNPMRDKSHFESDESDKNDENDENDKSDVSDKSNKSDGSDKSDKKRLKVILNLSYIFFILRRIGENKAEAHHTSTF